MSITVTSIGLWPHNPNPQPEGVCTDSGGHPLNTPLQNENTRTEMIVLNKESNKKVRIKVRLSEEENEKLKHCAVACGLSQSEFIRQLCKGKTPKPQPQKDFWELLEALYTVHNSFKSCGKYEPSALEACKEIECFILDLQEAG